MAPHSHTPKPHTRVYCELRMLCTELSITHTCNKNVMLPKFRKTRAHVATHTHTHETSSHCQAQSQLRDEPMILARVFTMLFFEQFYKCRKNTNKPRGTIPRRVQTFKLATLTGSVCFPVCKYFINSDYVPAHSEAGRCQAQPISSL